MLSRSHTRLIAAVPSLDREILWDRPQVLPGGVLTDLVARFSHCQLNALHDRMIELAKQHGLQGVQPEAVSFMHRAVRVVSNRLLAAAVLSSGKGASPPESEAGCTIKSDDLHDAIRLPVPAPWMAPPCQRAGSTLGAFSKFVS